MINIRNKKHQVIPLYEAPKNQTSNENDFYEKNPDNGPSNHNPIIFLILFILSLASLLFIANKIINSKKNKELLEMNVQANAHSIDKSQKDMTQTNENKNITKKKENKPQLKSFISIEKDNILGYGANGTVVYSGLFQNREMAIKRIIAQQADLAKQEMEILMKLDHPNIVKFYYYEEQKLFVFLLFFLQLSLIEIFCF